MPFAQEVTLAGAHVRTIAEGIITGGVYGIAATPDIIVAGTWSNGILIFDQASGSLLRSFSCVGKGEGQLYGNDGMRLTPDGGHILISEDYNNRLSLFSLSGEFVRWIGVGIVTGPLDVEFAANGDILVVDCSNCRVCVFSPDGSTLLRAFGTPGEAPGKLKRPNALSVHGDKLFVLDGASARVQVFN